jgi:hypothetical protein
MKQTDGRPDLASLYTYVLPPLNKGHHLTHIPHVRDNFPIHSTIWRWISPGRMFLAFKKSDHRTHLKIGGIRD